METQLSCYSRVPDTTLGGILSTSESMDILEDSDSFCYDIEEGCYVSYTEGERGETATGSAYTRRVDVIDIDCLTPEGVVGWCDGAG